jgi:hypothetical protein
MEAGETPASWMPRALTFLRILYPIAPKTITAYGSEASFISCPKSIADTTKENSCRLAMICTGEQHARKHLAGQSAISHLCLCACACMRIL